MSKSSNPALSRAINQAAHLAATVAFGAIRARLAAQARTMLKEGMPMEAVMAAVRQAALRDVAGL